MDVNLWKKNYMKDLLYIYFGAFIYLYKSVVLISRFFFTFFLSFLLFFHEFALSTFATANFESLTTSKIYVRPAAAWLNTNALNFSPSTLDRWADRRKRREEQTRGFTLPGEGRTNTNHRLEKSCRWEIKIPHKEVKKKTLPQRSYSGRFLCCSSLVSVFFFFFFHKLM